MSVTELKRGQIIANVIDGFLTQKKAAQELELSVRHVKRLCKRYHKEGPQGLCHKNRGKASNNKICAIKQKEAVTLLTKLYEGFGPQLAMEQLKENHRLEFSREWIRKLMIKEGLWKPKKAKRSKFHQQRPRRPQKGELLQIDGSYHDWFEGRGPKSCLLNMVDDATGEIMYMRFVEHENTKDYLIGMKEYAKRYGFPLAVYSDRHTIFKGKIDDSQFSRALKELGIKPIFANSPQAKGRVERSHGTLQDRLVKLMRLKNISSISVANDFLNDFRKDYNKRFGRIPINPIDAHKEVPVDICLDKILCLKQRRKVSKQLSIGYEGKTLLLTPRGSERNLVGKEAVVYDYKNKTIIELEGREYKYTVYEDQPYVIELDRKGVDAFMDKTKPLTVIQRYRKKLAVNY